MLLIQTLIKSNTQIYIKENSDLNFKTIKITQITLASFVLKFVFYVLNIKIKQSISFKSSFNYPSITKNYLYHFKLIFDLRMVVADSCVLHIFTIFVVL